jgi:hypothetical protein
MAHDHTHPPSHMRALVQESRSGAGRPPLALLDEARDIQDPSFAAEALFHIAGDPRLKSGDAGRALQESLHFLAKVERGWRQAEVVEEMARKAAKLRSDPASAALADRFLQSLTDLVLQMPAGQAASKAIQAMAKAVPPGRRGDLLAKALRNTGSVLQDAKAVADGSPESVRAILASQDPAVRARLLAHLHVHHKSGTLAQALQEVQAVPDLDRLELLRAIVASIEAPADLHAVRAALAGGPEERARALAALAGRADRLGDRAAALAWFGEAAALAAEVPDAKARAAIRGNLAQGLERAGEAGRAAELSALAEQDKASAAAAATGARAAGESSAASAMRPTALSGSLTPAVEATPPPAAVQGHRHILALVDTYEGGLGEVHLRAVARAAPLCDAFGLGLALVGFPTDNLGALLKQAMAETNVGEGGRHIQDLVAGGHVHLVHATHRQMPDLSGLGHPVATTPEPDPRKALDFGGCLAAAKAAAAPRLVVLMGLGRKGLPASFLKAAPAHLELTGRNVSLETATAMGVIAERMRQLPPLRP